MFIDKIPVTTLEALSINFVILKLINILPWSWWIVLTPIMIQSAFVLIYFYHYRKWEKRNKLEIDEEAELFDITNDVNPVVRFNFGVKCSYCGEYTPNNFQLPEPDQEVNHVTVRCIGCNHNFNYTFHPNKEEVEEKYNETKTKAVINTDERKYQKIKNEVQKKHGYSDEEMDYEDIEDKVNTEADEIFKKKYGYEAD